jgi:hypothetical protein
MTNSAQLKLACQGVLDDGVDANLSHTGGQPLLDDAVESAAMREIGFVNPYSGMLSGWAFQVGPNASSRSRS